ncbi:hypothetical protein MMC25_000203 [Agyrium rufum]|nr:hypothetical protein [Agyrium rufum]
MVLSKSTRIMILLAIDSAFFLLELIVGYSVHSLALVADSFHMLNDVLSLCVGLWAVKVANDKTNSKMYTYGWQRAETLGALVNGVFLVALCLSIFLDAIQRFIEPQEVSNPKLVLIVGCFGLASNILGLFLFHEHGHSHGAEGDSHKHGAHDEVAVAEEGHAHSHHRLSHGSGSIHTEEDQNELSTSHGRIASEPIVRSAPAHKVNFTRSDEDESTAASTASPISMRRTRSASHRRHRRMTSGSRSRYTSVDELPVHPASLRHNIIEASRLDDIDSAPGTDESEGDDNAIEEATGPTAETNGDVHEVTESSPLLGATKSHQSAKRHDSASWHKSHNHAKPKSKNGGGHGHSHGDLNMRGVFLHVMGDALGNIGVIASALIIWLTTSPYRFYSDPLISLIITIIILGSAIPLCRAASRILLQAVPSGISIDDIKEDIQELPGIISCHHVHVWQLSNTKLVASLHVQVGYDFKGEGSARYMALARAIRHCLHEYGIHSSTIQPEFCLDEGHRHTLAEEQEALRKNGGSSSDASSRRGGSGKNGALDGSADLDASPVAGATRGGIDGLAVHAAEANLGSGTQRKQLGSRTVSLRSEADACLLDCGDECGDGKGCCPVEPSTGLNGQ